LNTIAFVVGMDVGGDHRQPRDKRKAV